jgi:hypothetical protein
LSGGGLIVAAAMAGVLAAPQRAHANKTCFSTDQCPAGHICCHGFCLRPRQCLEPW